MPAGTAPRVLQVLTCDDVGGTEAMLASMLERLDRGRVDTDVVTLSCAGPVAARAAAAGVRVRVVGGDGFAIACVRLARIIARERFDVINAYGLRATAVVRVLAAALAPSAAFVSGVRGLHVTELERIDGVKSRALLRLERLGAPLVDAYDANSRGAVELLAAAGIDRGKLHYIPNGIDTAGWMRADPAAGDPPQIVCVARFVARKRQVDLVEAAAELARRGAGFTMVLAGDGPYLARVRASAAAAGVDDRISFPGRVTGAALRRLLAASSVFALCSLWEGMAGSVMEAMAAGLPVVGTSVNGIADLVVAGETGLLVDPRRPELLADALGSLLADPQACAGMGAAGRVRIESAFGLNHMVREKELLYRRLAGAA